MATINRKKMFANRKTFDIGLAFLIIATKVTQRPKNVSAGIRQATAHIKKALMEVEDIQGLREQLQRNRERASDAARVHIFKSKKPKQTSS